MKNPSPIWLKPLQAQSAHLIENSQRPSAKTLSDSFQRASCLILKMKIVIAFTVLSVAACIGSELGDSESDWEDPVVVRRTYITIEVPPAMAATAATMMGTAGDMMGTAGATAGNMMGAVSNMNGNSNMMGAAGCMDGNMINTAGNTNGNMMGAAGSPMGTAGDMVGTAGDMTGAAGHMMHTAGDMTGTAGDTAGNMMGAAGHMNNSRMGTDGNMNGDMMGTAGFNTAGTMGAGPHLPENGHDTASDSSDRVRNPPGHINPWVHPRRRVKNGIPNAKCKRPRSGN